MSKFINVITILTSILLIRGAAHGSSADTITRPPIFTDNIANIEKAFRELNFNRELVLTELKKSPKLSEDIMKGFSKILSKNILHYYGMKNFEKSFQCADISLYASQILLDSDNLFGDISSVNTLLSFLNHCNDDFKDETKLRISIVEYLFNLISVQMKKLPKEDENLPKSLSINYESLKMLFSQMIKPSRRLRDDQKILSDFKENKDELEKLFDSFIAKIESIYGSQNFFEYNLYFIFAVRNAILSFLDFIALFVESNLNSFEITGSGSKNEPISKSVFTNGHLEELALKCIADFMVSIMVNRKEFYAELKEKGFDPKILTKKSQKLF